MTEDNGQSPQDRDSLQEIGADAAAMVERWIDAINKADPAAEMGIADARDMVVAGMAWGILAGVGGVRAKAMLLHTCGEEQAKRLFVDAVSHGRQVGGVTLTNLEGEQPPQPHG